MAALRLGQRRLGLRVALVNAEEAFVERVRLQESIVSPVEPRIPELSMFLRKTPVEFLRARVISVDAKGREIRIDAGGTMRSLRFGQVIFALGSHVDAEAVPGSSEFAFRLDPGDGSRSAAALRSALFDSQKAGTRVLAVGGGPLSVEAAAEVKTNWPRMDVSLLSASSTGDFTSARVREVLRRDLTRLGVKLVDGERVIKVTEADVLTESGKKFPYDICIWAGGMQSPSLAKEAGLDVDDKNRILVGPRMRSQSHPFVLAAGDCAHPTAPTGAPYRLSALTAAVSGVYAAEEAIAFASGRRTSPFGFSTFAQAIAVGRFGAVFPLDPNDRPILFVLGGRAARLLRGVLIWLVLHFITFERWFPGVQSWPGRHRQTTSQQADVDGPIRPGPSR
jgi:NADH dehydrogenase FAD-containing subunit